MFITQIGMMVSQIYTHLKTPDVHTLNKYSSSYTVPHSRTIHTLITVYSHPQHSVFTADLDQGQY